MVDLVGELGGCPDNLVGELGREPEPLLPEEKGEAERWVGDGGTGGSALVGEVERREEGEWAKVGPGELMLVSMPCKVDRGELLPLPLSSLGEAPPPNLKLGLLPTSPNLARAASKL